VSDTPRTDEQINGKPCTRFAILAGDSLRDALVPSEFCRQLERELNAAQKRIKMLEVVERLSTAQMDYIQQLETENDAMRADLLLWRESK